MTTTPNPFITAAAIMTADEVAGLLRLRPSTVADLARRGDLPSVKLGRHRRYLRDDVMAYVIAQRQS
jgi:excisionase family DNA binding protein